MTRIQLPRDKLYKEIGFDSFSSVKQAKQSIERWSSRPMIETICR